MTEREIGGALYRCAKLPAEPGLSLFLRVSAQLSSARGLFEAIAASEDGTELIREFFGFAEVMDPDKVHALITELAALPRRVDGEKPAPADLNELLELAFLAIATNFSDFLPAGLETIFPEDRFEAEMAPSA